MTDMRRSARRPTAMLKSLKETESSSDSEDFDENIQKSPIARKTKVKELSNDPIDNQAAPAVKRRKMASNVSVKDLHLIDVICNHQNMIVEAVREWISDYKSDRSKATAELLTVLVQASSCDYTLTTDDVNDSEVDNLVKEFAQQVMKEGGLDLFKSRSLRGFAPAYRSFWSHLIRALYDAELLSEDFLTDKITNFVIALSCSVVRPFRYGATLTALQLITSWVEIHSVVSEARDKATFQYEAEVKKAAEKKTKAQDKAGQDIIAAFKRSMDAHHRTANDLQLLISNLFNAVFAHRFRDISEEIRALVIEGIGAWVKASPALFLSDNYLKYLAWALSDKDAPVRLAALAALRELYAMSPQTITALHEFTLRFKPRFCEMVFDINHEVAVSAIHLLSQLVRTRELARADVGFVARLLTEPSAELRAAAGELVASVMEVEEEADKPASKKGGQGKHKGNGDSGEGSSNSQRALSALLRVMTWLADEDSAGEPGLQPLPEEAVGGLVDTLYDRVPALHNWEALEERLNGSGAGSSRGAAANLVHVAQLLEAAAKRAVAASGVALKQRGKASNEERQALTRALAGRLPALIRKYQGDTDVLASLLLLPRHFQLEEYVLSQGEERMEELVRLVAEQLLRQADPAAIRAAAETLLDTHRRAPEGIRDMTAVVLSDTVSSLSQHLVSAAKAVQALPAEDLQDALQGFQTGEPGAAPELHALRLALTRTYIMLTRGARTILHAVPVYQALNFLMDDVASGRQMGGVITALTAQCMFVMMLWGIHTVSSSTQSDGAVIELVGRRSSYLRQLEAIYEVSEGDDQTRDEIFRLITDTLLVFAGEKWKGSPMEAAVLDIPDSLLSLCWQHVCDVLDRNPEPEEPTENEGAPPPAETGGPKEEAVVGVGRLLLYEALAPGSMQARWLGANLLANLVQHGQGVRAAVEEVARGVRRRSPGELANFTAGAMELAFNAITEQQSVGGANARATQLPGFSRLCNTLAGLYAGHNLSAAELRTIVTKGITFGMSQAPSRLDFLAWGLIHFTSKLSAEACESAIAQLEEAAAALPWHDEEEREWASYSHFLQALKDAAGKGRVAKGVLKGGQSTHGTGARAKRISFVPVPGDEQPEAAQTGHAPVLAAHTEAPEGAGPEAEIEEPEGAVEAEAPEGGNLKEGGEKAGVRKAAGGPVRVEREFRRRGAADVAEVAASPVAPSPRRPTRAADLHAIDMDAGPMVTATQLESGSVEEELGSPASQPARRTTRRSGASTAAAVLPSEEQLPGFGPRTQSLGVESSQDLRHQASGSLANLTQTTGEPSQDDNLSNPPSLRWNESEGAGPSSPSSPAVPRSAGKSRQSRSISRREAEAEGEEDLEPVASPPDGGDSESLGGELEPPPRQKRRRRI